MFWEAEQAGLGTAFAAPVDVIFDQYNVTSPDLVFVVKDRLGILTEANIQGAPDIIVEILSPSTRRRDLGIKMQIYARFGAPWYFVVDARARTVQPYELIEGAYSPLPLLRDDDLLSCPLLPGVTTSVAVLFR
ncbi:MAG: Uma2 family endonuclease [Chloroflexota bacterium]